MGRNKTILKRICRNQRSIYYLYDKLDIPLEISDKILFEGYVCWCKSCKRFSKRRNSYKEVPQLFGPKGWVRVWPWSYVEEEKTREQEVAALNLKYCLEGEKENAWQYILNEKKKRNQKYSKTTPTKSNLREREAPDPWDYDY